MAQPLENTIEQRAQKRNILLLALGHFTNDTYPGFLAPLQPLLMSRIGYGLTLAGLLTSIQAIATSITQPIFGHLSDRMKRPYLVVFGPLITAVFAGSIGLWHHYLPLTLIILISGLGTAAFHPQAAVLTGQNSGRRRGLSMSIFVTGGNAGHALGPVIILAVVSLMGLEYSYITIGYGVAVSWILWRFLPRSLPNTSPPAGSPRFHPVRSGHGYALFLLWWVVFIRAFIISGFLTFGPIYLHDKQFSLVVAGVANTIFEIAGSLGAMLGGTLSDLMGRKSVILLSLILALPFFLAYLYSDGYISLFFLALAGFFLYSSISVNIIMAQELFPQRSGTVSSLMMGFAWGVGGLCVTPLGAIAEKIGVPGALHGLSYLTLIAFAAAWFIPDKKSRQEIIP
ncbi:MFS transporter [candidate division KSB1 bacterium]|nr:MFS transporter [candidate division KSB1 bacterium]